MNRLEELLILILDRAHKSGKPDLSRFEMFKIVYLLQVYSLKYAGTSLLQNVTFLRQKNGPISIDIYKSLSKLEKEKHIKMHIKENKDYGYPRHCFNLNTKYSNFDNFERGERIFLDGFLLELLPLTQSEIKKKAYSTEPMKAITKKEKQGTIKKGEVINFVEVSVDPDVIDTYAS